MKSLTKIFLVVASGLFAFSCVTDLTADLGIKIEGHTTFTVSLEESRTELGDRNADGKYPLYWSAGDQLSINGVASDPLSESYEGQAAAYFSFSSGILTPPYCVVHPAPTGAGEGTVYPVTFLAEQAYTEGTFAAGAAPMYGYAASHSETIQLHHLTGILRLAVKGNGEALTSVVAKSAIGKIAGPFTVDCKSGKLMAQDGASNTVTVTFDEPLVLGSETQYIYIAVPAGIYGDFILTLHTATDKMTLKFNTTSKPILAGAVREFKEFTYQANDISDESTVFEIDSKDALIEFANAVNGGTFNYTAAAVVADIDMSGYDWTPIEGFNGMVFDGGATLGYSINGLNAPLFGTTSSAIMNTNLTDVNIASNGRLALGAVACVLAESEQCAMINCKVSGNITVSNPDTAIASGSDAYLTVNVGGVVGTAYGNVTNCVNEANITVNQVAKSDNAVAVHPIIGGVVGHSVVGAVTNCVNGNEAKTTGAINYHDNQAAQLYVPHVGGVAGSGAADNVSAFHNNTNYGAIDFLANTAGTGELSRNSTTIGGVIASSFHNVENNDNYGTITVSGGKIKGFILGGVVGTTTPAVRLYNCHNHQGANITVDSDVAFWALNVAGVVGTFSGSAYVDTCTNDAPIHVKASTDTNATANGSQLYRVGGVITYTNNTVKNCENKANGDITVEGNITLLRANNQPGYGVAGVSCYHTTDGTTVNLINRGDINVYTNVTPTATWNTTTTHMTYGKIDIAGICGYDTKAKRDFQNYGNITIGRAESPISITGNGLHIGGLASYYSNTLTTTTLTENINKGKITIINATLCGTFTPTIGDTANTWTTCIGGIAAYPTGNLSKSKNEGAISLDATTTIATAAYIGGVSGKVVDDTLSAVKNSGAMNIGGAVSGGITYVGGIVGNTTGAITTSENSGAINVSATTSAQCYAGGIVGNTTGAITTSENNGAITANGTYSSDLYAGGVVGYTTATELSGVKNNVGGAMTIGGTINGQSYIGGITGTYAGALTSCENHGNILFNGTCASNKHFYIAGITGYSTSTAITSCLNTGDITIDKCSVASSSSTEYMVCLSGIVGYQATNVATFKNCSNSGTLQITKNVSSNFVTRVGGILGGTNKSITLDNCHNSMKANAEYGIILKHTTTTGAGGSNQARAGGLIGWQHGGTLTTKNGVSNSADCYFACINKDTGGSSYGGIAGVLGGNAHSFGGTISNSGDLHYAGASHAGTFSIGGLFGQSGNKAPTLCEDLQNTGNITVENTNNNWKPTAAKKAGVIGGIIGYHDMALSNAKSVCTITAIGFEDDHGNDGYYNAVGGITGRQIATGLTNCHVGGSIILTDTNTPGALSVSNYAAYLSGDHTFDAATAKTQECGFITSIDDTTPEYAE